MGSVRAIQFLHWLCLAYRSLRGFGKFFGLRTLKDLLFSLKKEVKHCIDRLEVGQGFCGLERVVKDGGPPIFADGLGVRNLIQFNQAFLGKWLWCFAMGREALLRLVAEAKYGMCGGWCSIEVGSFGVGVRKKC